MDISLLTPHYKVYIMLQLTTPIQLGTHTYNVLVFLLGKWHWGARLIETDLVPADEQEQFIRLGSEKPQGEGKRVFNAPIVAHLRLPDTVDGDPVFAQIMEKFQEAQDLLEQYAVASGLLDSIVYESGEDTYSLQCTYVPGVKKYVMHKIEGGEKKEKETKIVQEKKKKESQVTW